MSLSLEMRDSLRHELNLHDGCHELPLCLHLIIIAACIQTDNDWDEEIYEASKSFILDEILTSCILKGAIEPGGINEDGEFTYEITDFGRSQCAESEEERRRRSGQQDRPQEPDQGEGGL